MAGLLPGSDGNFYGTTRLGGIFNLGTVFQITTNGSLATIFSFNGDNGCYPLAALAQGDDGNFYGTTAYSNPNAANYGTVFRLTRSGVLTTLVNLNGANGLHPYAGMILGHDGYLYGTMDDVNAHQLLDGSSSNVFRLLEQPLIRIVPNDGGTVLSWNSISNEVYWLEYKYSLADPAWIPLVTNVAGGNVTSFTNSLLNGTQRFYQVVLPQ